MRIVKLGFGGEGEEDIGATIKHSVHTLVHRRSTVPLNRDSKKFQSERKDYLESQAWQKPLQESGRIQHAAAAP